MGKKVLRAGRASRKYQHYCSDNCAGHGKPSEVCGVDPHASDRKVPASAFRNLRPRKGRTS